MLMTELIVKLKGVYFFTSTNWNGVVASKGNNFHSRYILYPFNRLRECHTIITHGVLTNERYNE